MSNWVRKKNDQHTSDIEPESTETFESDDEEEYDEDEDIEDISFWREHGLAILVAFAASIIVHFHNQNLISLSGFLNRLPFGTNSERHSHLDGFSRMANVSFCRQRIQPPASERLNSMDFYIPRDHFESLLTFYVADLDEDDYYANTDIAVSSSRKEDLGARLKDNKEFECLSEQHHINPTDKKLKGTTYFYKDPTLEEIYPELMKENTTPNLSMVKKSSNERKRQLEQPPLRFTGFAAKFVNLDTDPVLLYWDGKGGHESSRKLVVAINRRGLQPY
ncbi:unnamed protein product [Pseudo-nitzschia multistriata]|uniref:Uncharacterized protein n=1 Tax=Pseudo-nitzschia multistriata TaxID=183589 RepID=A0A448Z8Z9_9STRA|nr:unnamed protein product [Pseudo-nitzschia multistriata]